MADGYARATGKVAPVAGHERSGGDQHRHRHRERLHGLDPDGRLHGAGRHARHRHRRVPGIRHHRHHDADHQAQLPGQRRGRDCPRSSRRRSTSPRRDVPVRSSSTCRSTSARASSTSSTPRSCNLPGYKPTYKGHAKQIKQAAKMIHEGAQAAALRGWRRDRSGRLGGAQGARRAHAAAGDHHDDGQGRRSRRTITCGSACPACTAPSTRTTPSPRPTCSSRSACASTIA